MGYWLERLRERWASPSKEYRKETAIEGQKKYGEEIILEAQTVESLSRLKVQRGTIAIEA